MIIILMIIAIIILILIIVIIYIYIYIIELAIHTYIAPQSCTNKHWPSLALGSSLQNPCRCRRETPTRIGAAVEKMAAAADGVFGII